MFQAWRRTRNHWIILACLWVATLIWGIGPAVSAEQPPNGDLRVGARRLWGGKLFEVYHLTLSCFGGSCTLTTLTLNDCNPFIHGPAFYPRMSSTSTKGGDLTISVLGVGALVAEEKRDTATIKHKFTYAVTENPGLSKRFGIGSGWFNELMGYSGAGLGESVTGKIDTWELVPLRGRIAFVELKCSIWLGGVPE